MRIVVLTGGIGGARFLGRRARPRAADRRRGHGGGQRRRRRAHARPADLPRPGQRDVHAGRRGRPRARLGPGRRDLGGQGGAGRSTAPSRPGSAWATRTRPPIWYARTMLDRRLSAVRGHRRPVRALAARHHAAARPPTTGWRPTWSSTSTASARRSTSRSGGCATAATCRPTGSSSSAPRPPSRRAGVLEAIAGADVVLVAPEQPGGQHRADPGRHRSCATPWSTARRRSSGSRRSSAAPRCAAWPTSAWPPSASR